ncbi:MAG: AgmX/PglI C-terminal domain-containing protein [Candidatus Eisenbacteria bacterium]|nr:AgmX/PglI C-terminal domain-containing protein [Candidatus Eisenbacteria bacterium]
MQIRDIGVPALEAIAYRRGLSAFGLEAIARRQASFWRNRSRVARAAMIAASFFALMFAIALGLAPMLRRNLVIIELPTHTATILPEPVRVRPAAEKPLQEVAVRQVAEPRLALPDHFSLPAPKLTHEAAPENDAARHGRERAQQVTAELASTTGQLDRALRDLQASLKGSQGEYAPATRTHPRGVRGGRSDAEVPEMGNGAASAGRADLGGSTVQGERVAIGTLAPAKAEDAPAAEDGTPAAGSAPGVYRTNASLLAVIRRYAAGIQYCYDTELKRDPALKGKLVMAITVAASGAVTDARVVQNTVGSASLVACALGQIRDWRFPAIPAGVTTFQAPFVFTPPN